ncbi:MAG TPA: hypothetical protein VIO15_13080 [Bacteroidales bacterium]
MNIAQIFRNNESWIAEKLKVDLEYFKNLSKGQNPEVLYIGCSDSRVTAEELMGQNPERYLSIGTLLTWFLIPI